MSGRETYRGGKLNYITLDVVEIICSPDEFLHPDRGNF